jgi:hypothetical protein
VNHRHFAPIWLLVLAVSGALAQEPQPDTPDESAPVTAETTAPTAAGEEAPVPAATAGRETSPFDYRASEQISEDLSVSFPVDI